MTYINESAEPNVHLKSRVLLTTRAIEAGEEITLKYPDLYNRDYKLVKKIGQKKSDQTSRGNE